MGCPESAPDNIKAHPITTFTSCGCPSSTNGISFSFKNPVLLLQTNLHIYVYRDFIILNTPPVRIRQLYEFHIRHLGEMPMEGSVVMK